VRRLALLATFVALTTSAAGSTAARAATGEPACRTAEVRQHDEAVFGHFANRADALKLKARARAKGFQVTFEQTLPPMAFKQGQVVGIFAAKRTLDEANVLMQRLAPIGFRYIDIARSPTRWLVVMPQVPVKQALSIAREVSTAGFRITFRPGAQ